MSLKLKKSPSPAPSFSWNDLLDASSPETGTHVEPPISFLSARDMKTFGAEPLKNEVGVIKCKDCSKPVLQSAVTEHTDNCKKVRNAEADLKKGKKRKADEVDTSPDDPSQPKKKKPATKVTKGRFKGPVDFDKQCGVINDKGLPCSRSLTCKSHSMGAKRAVQGRSKAYDELLLEWNRANNPNWVEPVKKETKAERKEKKEREKAEKKRQAMEAAIAAGQDPNKKGPSTKKKKTQTTTTTANIAQTNTAGEDAQENLDDLDSEAEMDSLVRAVRTARSRGVLGVPMALPSDAEAFFVARRERLRNCRELLHNALAPNGNRGSIASGVPGIGSGTRLG